MKEIKNAVIGVIVLAITSAGGVMVNKLIGEEEEKPAVESPTQPTIVVNVPQQEVKKDTVIKKVYVKPEPVLTETEKRKKKLDW